ncbi:hypothetical protein D3C71_2249920 [compost metagenome]
MGIDDQRQVFPVAAMRQRQVRMDELSVARGERKWLDRGKLGRCQLWSLLHEKAGLARVTIE